VTEGFESMPVSICGFPAMLKVHRTLVWTAVQSSQGSELVVWAKWDGVPANVTSTEGVRDPKTVKQSPTRVLR
jgi:hypothetical protein